jgi:hypothetical protein
MRYQEAYELIRATLGRLNVTVVYTDTLLNTYFEDNVRRVGLANVHKKRTETTAVGSGLYAILHNEDMSNKIYLLQLGEKKYPMLPEPAKPNIGADVVSDTSAIKLAWYYKEDQDLAGLISSVSLAATLTRFTTSAVHGLEVGDWVEFSEIVGLLSAPNTLSGFNGIRHRVVTINSTTQFEVAVASSGYGVPYASGGRFQQSTRKIYFTKTPDSGGDVKAYYYAAPRPRNSIVSEVDLPDFSWVRSAMQYTIADVLEDDGQLKFASGYRGMGKRRVREEHDLLHLDEASMDMLPSAYQPFIET